MANRPGPPTRYCAPLLIAALASAALGSQARQEPAPRTAEPEPLRAVLHLKVGNPSDKERRNLRLDRPGVLPLKAGDRFWIEVRLNRPAYLYLLWAGSDGKVAPIYPWKPGKWDQRPATERKHDRLDMPRNEKEAWEIPPGKPGIETLLLLVREGSPLPPKDDELLARMLDGPRIALDTLIKDAVWVENGREITIDRQDRAVPSKKIRKSNDPVLAIRRLLEEKIRPSADYYHAIVFPVQGGR